MRQRHNITLTPEIDEKLNQFAYLKRKTRSTIIEEALKQYFSGLAEEKHPSGDEKISVLEERINVIEAKIRDIEKAEGISGPKKTDNENIPKDNSIAIDPEGWYSQSFLAEFLDPSILLSTRKSIVSLAVSRGEMETNGKKRKGCRIKGSSAITWIKSMKKQEKPPVFFLGS